MGIPPVPMCSCLNSGRDYLTLEGETHMLSENAGNQLPMYDA